MNKLSNISSDMVKYTIEDEGDKSAFSSLNLNPSVKWARFVLTDDKPNGNKQRIPESEFRNIIQTGVFMPVKVATGSIKEGHEATLIHEASHMIWNMMPDEKKKMVDLPKIQTPDQDEYLEDPRERFSYLTEMKYFKIQGKSFDQYFRAMHSTEFLILQNPNETEEKKELASLDYQDYKKIWDYIKIASRNWLQKICMGL